MSGVFLSYSRGDRSVADEIIRGLRAVGVVVWWDEDMHSIDWHQELERQIVELASIVVLWTPKSASSDHVKDEARLGLESGKLINAIVGLPKPPFPYDRVNALPLDGWTEREREPHNGWTRLIETIEDKVVEKGGAKAGEFTQALARREEAFKQKQQALTRAQEALEEAQARQAETIDAAQAAQATFLRAEEQHVRVMEMRATHLIMSAAAQEYEAARAAKEGADRAQRAAKAELKGAAREVALAAAAMESLDAPAHQPRAEAPATDGAAPVANPAPAAPVVAAPAPATPLKASPKPAPALAPASAATASVAAATSAPAASPNVVAEPAKGSMRRMLTMAATVVVVLAGAVEIGAFVLNRHSSSAAKSAAPEAPAASAAVEPMAADPTAADPTTAAVKAAAVLAGNWTPQGLSCDSPIAIAVQNGAVSMTMPGTTSTAAIEPSSAAGVINARGEDGGKYSYSLGQDNVLSMVDPSNQTQKMTKCAG